MSYAISALSREPNDYLVYRRDSSCTTRTITAGKRTTLYESQLGKCEGRLNDNMICEDDTAMKKTLLLCKHAYEANC